MNDELLEERTYSKVAWRLILFLFSCCVVAYLDRVNVGYSKLQLLNEFKFSEAMYCLGAGVFVIGYLFFDVPSNIILRRTGARIWIARIMVTWGVLSAATMFVSNEYQFYTIRFFFGMADAGFFPSTALYLTYWLPAAHRARAAALFMTAIALAGVVGGPLSGWIMQCFASTKGWAGWHWLFLLEGIPSVVVGILVLFYLDDSIQGAKWLNADEKELLVNSTACYCKDKLEIRLGQLLNTPRVWLMSAIYLCFILVLYGMSFLLSQFIDSAGVKYQLNVSLLSAIPYGFAAVTMVLTGCCSDRTGVRRWHISTAAVAGALGLVLSGIYGGNLILAMGALTLVTTGILTSLPMFWTLPTAFLGGTAAAAGIAVIYYAGNLPGFATPYMVGAIQTQLAGLLPDLVF
jgi:MFS family permease